MLAGPGFRNYPRLAHVLGQQRLTDGVIHLVCASVVEIFTLEPDLCATELLRPSLCQVQRRRATHIVGQIVVEIRAELRIVLETRIHGCQFVQSPHQGFRNETATKLAEVATRIRKSRKIRAFRHQLLLVF